jgi:hypothetical protein
MFSITAFTKGANPYIIEDYTELTYTKVSNGVGTAVLTVPLAHAAVTGLALDDEIEIWRGNPYPTWSYDYYVDWRGFYRGSYKRRLYDGREVADLLFWHETQLLQRSVNAYKAGIANYSTWTSKKTDRIMYDLVTNNFASAAGSRITTATSKNLLTGTYSAFGSTIDYSAAYRNVLTCIQELATIDRSVFSVEKPAGSSAWYFTAFPTTIATDRRDILFDVGRENIIEVALNDQATAATVAIVGGQGEDSNRTVVAVTSADRNIGTNNLETFLDARHLTTSGSISTYGAANLEDNKNRQSIRFQPLQKPAFAYGKHYAFGDIVSVRFKGVTSVQRIREATIQVTGTEERIQIATEDL